MKRRKQDQELDISLSDERTQKRTHKRTVPHIGEVDAVDEVELLSPKGKLSLREKETEESEPDDPFLEAPSENDEYEDNQGDDEEETETSAENEVEEDVSLTESVKLKEGIKVFSSNHRKKAQTNRVTPVKGARSKKLFSTPVQTNRKSDETPKLERHADRSARRKSTRNLIERTILGNTSDNEEEDDGIARHIYGLGEVENEENDVQHEMEVDDGVSMSAPETPSKITGRRKGSNKEKSPAATDLPPHELYFSQNRGGRNKTSNNNLSSLQLLDHEEFFTLLHKFKEPHEDDLAWLQELHAGSFNQWQFELSQNFNICLFGWGSKMSLLMKFADHLYKSHTDHSAKKIVVVNGYIQTLTIRDVLNSVGVAISEPAPKLGSQPADMLKNLLDLLEENSPRHITVIIHSIDRAPLRRPATQTILSRLSSHPQIHLVASADHPSFPLLWDSSLRSNYNFLFHDCTTFQPYLSEIDVVDEVHELLGRSGRRIGGKEGVSFVLKSLPENAKNLFRVLIGEQLAAMDNSSSAAFGDDINEEDDNEARNDNSRSEQGVEYRVLYQKAVEEFICSNEMNFRTLLKEFHDHQMIQSRKDALGTEMLSVPFRKEELETILEDIVS